MNKIAVFGKPGGGKSTLSKRLASATGIKLHALDSIEFKKNGEKIDSKIYEEAHQNILSSGKGGEKRSPRLRGQSIRVTSSFVATVIKVIRTGTNWHGKTSIEKPFLNQIS